MASNIKDIDKGWRNMYRNVKAGELPTQISIGVFGYLDAEAPTRAWLNETGHNNRPIRPFLSTTFDRNVDTYFRALLPRYGRVGFKWRLDMLRGGAQDVARMMARDVVATINSGVRPRNAASTVRQKGHGRTLRDSNLMRDSVGYRRKGTIYRDF